MPAAALNRARQVYIETFGCQMNELDSELVRGQLQALGYRFTSEPAGADVVLYNTCSVREQAENKVLSRVGLIGMEKERGSPVILGLIGCLAEREGVALLRRYPQIDLLCGPGELDRLPLLIDNAFRTEAVEMADRVALQGSTSRRSSTLAAAADNLELLDLSRAFDPDPAGIAGGRAAYVRITRGCNKFCTYCVVPYTRGPEVHRPPDHIVEECRRLAEAGVIEITLLGQTVNHYVYTHGAAVSIGGIEQPQVGPGAGAFRGRNGDRHREPGGSSHSAGDVAGAVRSARTTTFADLLKRIHDEVPALRRLRFVTSYPRDFGDDILRVMADSPRICRYLHAPAQSGSNRILKLMNRGYTVEEYLDFVDRARAIVPGISIAGDIIVGFPTESEADFAATRALLERVRFKNNFIFKYSPRPGTAAIERYPDDVPDHIKRARNNELLALQGRISAEAHAGWIGRVVDVFVEQVSERSQGDARRERARARAAGNASRIELRWEPPVAVQQEVQPPTIQLSGRTDGDLITVFNVPDGETPAGFLGRIVRVRVTGSGPLLLLGELAVNTTDPAAVP
jgi:tRNA-2-methylthio-N6-dimethylallyladenosine synthase